jgi:hypothetical protein
MTQPENVTKQLIFAGDGIFQTFPEVAEYIITRPPQDDDLTIFSHFDCQVLGGLMPGETEQDDVFVTDGRREGVFPHDGRFEGAVMFIAHSASRYEDMGNVVVHVEPRNNNLIDRGIAYLTLQRAELTFPIFSMSVRHDTEVTNPQEISERLGFAYKGARLMLEDMLNGIESPRFAKRVDSK